MPKRLILCCDGTWNTAGQRTPTNVTRFYQSIAPVDQFGKQQLAFYHPGVGTTRWERLIGGAFGFGLSGIVLDVYKILVEHYEPGDELFFLGFSRGAFTARSSAGLVRNAGILRRDQAHRIGQAYALYRSHEGPDAPSAIDFRRNYAVAESTPIRFIGVWDTVGSLGVPDVGLPGTNFLNRRWQFHDVTLSKSVQSAFQVLAIDEARRPFQPTLWAPQPNAVEQQLEQVWFAGVHCDVGGGYPERDLADVTLSWMTSKAHACGLAVKPSPAVAPTAALGPLHDSRTALYRLLAPSPRTLGAKDPVHEAAASSAVERHNAGKYAPKCLVTYLDNPQHHETAIAAATT